MQVENLLICRHAIGKVQRYPVTTKTGSPQTTCNLLAGNKDGFRVFLADVNESNCMSKGDDENVSLIDGLDIHERCDSVVPINHRGTAIAGENIAKDAAHVFGSDDWV